MRNYRNYSKVSKTPRRPFEKERIDSELKLCGEHGLRCKREVWRLQYTLAKLRKAARELLTLPANDSKRIFEGSAILNRCTRLGLLDAAHQKLDYVLALGLPDLLKRRLQRVIVDKGLTHSVHKARVLIRQRHIRVGKQVVNVPSFLVRVDSENHVEFAESSPFGGGRPGRIARRNERKGAGSNEDDE